MTLSQYNRRNFLGSMAILSVGSAFGSTLKHFDAAKQGNDLQKNWTTFWKRCGGRTFHFIQADASDVKKETKGHRYNYGEPIYFPRENVLARPTWIFWQNNYSKPDDVIIHLFENNHPFNKIIVLNRYEMDALYRVSRENDTKELLLASFVHKTPSSCKTAVIETKTSVRANSKIQDICYYKEGTLIFKDKIIYHN